MSRKRQQIDHFNIIATDLLDRIKVVPDTRRTLDFEWIPVRKERAEYPCIACDSWGNMPFIPDSIITLTDDSGRTRCFDGKHYNFNQTPEEFLSGHEIVTKSGDVYRVAPREIIAWMPLPKRYQLEEDEDET